MSTTTTTTTREKEKLLRNFATTTDDQQDVTTTTTSKEASSCHDDRIVATSILPSSYNTDTTCYHGTSITTSSTTITTLGLQQQYYPASSRNDETIIDENCNVIKLHKTVYTLLYDSNSTKEEHEEGETFLHKLWALIFLQFMFVIFISSPFALLASFQTNFVIPYQNILNITSTVGVLCSVSLAIWKGTEYPFAHVCLSLITIFAALGLGLTFALTTWGFLAYISICISTSCFAIVSSLIQFNNIVPIILLPFISLFGQQQQHHHQHDVMLTYPLAAMICFIVCIEWIFVIMEVTDDSTTFTKCMLIGLGSYVFTCFVLLDSYTVLQHASSKEYVLGVLFILCPQTLRLPFECYAKRKHKKHHYYHHQQQHQREET